MLKSLITKPARVRCVVVALIVYAVALPIMFGPWPGLVSRVSANCGGLAPFDTRGYWDATDVAGLIDACGTGGRQAYLNLELADLAYPAIAGTMLLLTTALLLRRRGGRAWPLLLPAIAMTGLDYLENAAVWTVLAQWPQVNTTVAALGGSVTAIKRVAGIIAYTIPLLLGGLEIIRWVRHPRASGQGPS